MQSSTSEKDSCLCRFKINLLVPPTLCVRCREANLGPSWVLRGWREESLAGWASIEGHCPRNPPWGLLVLALLSLRWLEAVRSPRTWPSLSSLALSLKDAWQSRVAAVAPLPPSVPFPYFGQWFQLQGSGKMFLDPNSGSCSVQPAHLAAPRLQGQVLAGLPAGAVCGKGPWIGVRQQGRI